MEDKRQNFQKAKFFYFKAIDVLKSKNENNDTRLKTLYANIGNVYTFTEKIDSTIYFHQMAYDLAIKIYGRDNYITAIDLRNLCIDYMEKGDYQKAISNLNQAIDIARKKLGDDHLELAALYYSIGDAYFYSGKNSMALNYYQKSLEIKLRQSDPPKISIAENYQNIANVMTVMGKYKASIDTLQKAIALIKQKLGAESLQLAEMYNNIADVYNKLKDNDNALIYFKRSYKIRKKNLQENTHSIGESYNNLGITYRSLGYYDLAERYLEKSLKIKKKVYGDINYFVAFGYFKLAELYLEIKNWPKAKYNLNISQHIISTLEKRRELNINDINLSIDVMNKEKIYYSQIPNKQKIDSLNNLISQRMDVLLQKSDDVVDKNFILEKTQNLYNPIIDFQYEFDPKSAFETSERSKYRLFNEIVNREELFEYSNVPDSVRFRKENIQTDVAYYEKLLYMNSTSKSLSDSLKKIYNDKIFQLKHAEQNLTEDIKSKYPKYFDLDNNSNSSTVESTQEMLSNHQTLIEYYISDSVLYTFVIGKKSFFINKIELPKHWNETISSIVKLHKNFDLQNKIDPISIQNYLNNSFAAYLILIQPIKDKLTKELVIIPDKNLSYLSFDALVTNQATTFTDAQYLIDDYQVSYEYSTKLWTYMKGKRGHYAKNLIAFSPDFPNPNFDWRKVDSIAQSYVLRDGLWELVYSKKECENIAKIWDTKLVFDGSATLSNFIQMAPSYQIIHLSTHGLADDRAGEFSYMAFTHVSDTMANKLYMRDLYGLKLNADLVVLSACQTGIGEYKNGEGVVSMALGFAYAGCKSIISTLWSVNDKSTEDIITSFYRYLKEGKSKDESLRLAKMDYRKANPHAGPYLWAAFIAVGDMEPIKDGWISWTYLLWAIGLVLVGLGLYKFISRSRQNELFE